MYREMKITNAKTYGLAESIVASGFPMQEAMRAAGETPDFEKKVAALEKYLNVETLDSEETIAWCATQVGRAERLAAGRGGESHDCFLCGIVVQANITAPRYWWPEFQRYHFADIVSSTSTMHRLSSFIERARELSSTEELWELVGEHFDTLNAQEPVVKAWMDCALNGNLSLEQLKASLPEGWLQTARITTNYRQLKTIYAQRHAHRLKEWRDFCDWILSLPHARLLFGSLLPADSE